MKPLSVNLPASFTASLAVLCLQCADLQAATSTLGSDDAKLCFEASLATIPGRSTSVCNEAILSGLLSRRDLAATYSNRGIILSKNGEYEKALADQNRALELKPDLPRARINRGNVLYRTLEFEKAIEDFDVAIKADPYLVTAHLNKALALMKLRRFEEARHTLQSALEIHPDVPRLIEKLAQVEEILAAEGGEDSHPKRS